MSYLAQPRLYQQALGNAQLRADGAAAQVQTVLAQTARERFDAIVGAFTNIKDRTASIATAAEQQARVTDEIHQLAERIRTISEQNAQDASQLHSMSRESTELAHELMMLSCR